MVFTAKTALLPTARKYTLLKSGTVQDFKLTCIWERTVLYQVLNKQVPVQVLCINYRHSLTLQLHKVKVVVSFIFKK